MDFVTPSPADIDLIDDDDDDDDDEEGEQDIELEHVLPKKSKTKSSRNNRRKTMGDEEESEKARGSKRRRTMGDTPSVSSSFHTQTLTQFLSHKDEEEEDWKIEYSEAETDLGLVEETLKRDVKTRDALETPSEADTEVLAPGSKLLREAPKETPSNQRSRLLEIPSSQSPATPMLLRYSPAKEPSPLKARSSNIGAPVATPKGIRKTPRTLEVQDTYSTTHSSPTTPTPKVRGAHSSGTKQLRFELPENKENITPGRTKPKSPKTIFEKASNRQPLREIPDSDEEDPDATESEEEEEEDASVSGRMNDESAVLGHEDNVAIAGDKSVENYDVSAETQAILISSDRPSEDEEEDDDEPTLPGPKDKAVPALEGSKEDAAEVEDEEVTPVAKPRRRLRSSPNKPTVEEQTAQTPTQAYTQTYTQGLESQRVPLETIQATGPISHRSDIIVSIYGEHVKRMVERTKTHEFRSWKMPESVHRVWVYITKPASELRYMFLMGPPRTRGEIDDDGIGNVEFNQGKKKAATYAYEVLQIYELNNPVSLETMKQHGWPTAPQKYAYVPPAIVGQLTANLRCALFDEENEDVDQGLIRTSPVRGSHYVTVSQEIAEQIRSDTSHSTQAPSDQPDIIPASPIPRKRAAPHPRGSSARNNGHDDDEDVFVRPVMPRSPSGALAAAAAGQESQRCSRGGYVRASQATTVSQVSTSSPVPSLEKAAPLPPAHVSPMPSSSAPVGSSSPTTGRSHRHSLRSSQLPTKSQMLPDSLINQQIEGPPSIIWDSADESD